MWISSVLLILFVPAIFLLPYLAVRAKGSFMDNELDHGQAAFVREHLIACPPCGRVCEDLTTILDVCETEPPSELVPPNSKALWQRIHNMIETEVKPPPAPQPRGRFWQLSFLQLSAALLCIAVVSSLLTVVGIKNYMRAPGETIAGTPATVRDALARQIAEAGVNYLVCRLAFGDMALAESLRSLELFARHVMPELGSAA